jgi:glycosyltransferase involved in cell wall biosynthesis
MLMNSVHIAINAIPFSPGGGLTGALGLSSAMKNLDNVKVTVFASKPETIQAVRETGVTVVPVAQGRGLLGRSWWQVCRFDRALRELGCDVLISTNHALPLVSIPQIVHHQNLWCFAVPVPPDPPNGGMIKHWIAQRLAKASLKRAFANVFVSEYLRRSAQGVCPADEFRSQVIYNGLDKSQILVARSGASQWSGEPIVCAVQIAVRQKDNATLLRAFADLVRRRPEVPWKLEIAGGGDWTSYVRMSEELGIRDRVVWHGHLRRPDLDALFRRSLCLMFTSYFESFGNPPVEAMSQACPVIAVDATAMPEVIGDAGILVQRGDAPAFADAALSLWEQRERRDELVQRGLRKALRYSWDSTARQFVGIARDAVESAHKAPAKGGNDLDRRRVKGFL